MENRLPLQRLLLLNLIVVCTLSFSTLINAQEFTINFTGEDTLFVGSDCVATLDWGHPNTVSFTAESGNKIDTFYIESISSGFQIGDVIRAKRTIFIDYYVEDTAGVSETIQNALRIVIADTTKPVFDLATLPNDTTLFDSGDVPLAPSISTVAASDNCGIEAIFYNGELPNTRPDCGLLTRSWTARDTAGNTTIYVQNIDIVSDTAAPVWTNAPSPLIISCDASVDVAMEINDWLAANGNAIYTDDSNVSVSHNYTGLTGCGVTGTATVIFTATDTCGNSSTTTGTINVTDNNSPIVTTEAIDTSVTINNPTISFNDWMAANGFAIAADFCTVIDNSDTSVHWTVASIDTTIACGNNATYVVQFEVADECGNVDSTMATFAIEETEGPNIIGLIDDQTELCGGDDAIIIEQWFIGINNQNPSDQNGNSLTFVEINYIDRDSSNGTWTGVGNPFNSDFIPEHDCTWYLDAEIIFRDECGNLGRDTARFSIIDTLQPSITSFPIDTTVLCGQVPVAVPDSILVSDNCDTSLTITVTEISDTTISAIIISRIYIATDDCNNSDSVTQLITVIDTIAPVLENVPTDTIVTCRDVPAPVILLTATDNCTDIIDLTYEFVEDDDQLSHPDSCQTYNYTITRTYVVTDAFNNSVSAVQRITVVDTVAPSFTVPVDITVSCELRDDLMITGQPSNLSDNCDTIPDFSFTDFVKGGDCIGTGVLDTIIRTWTVMDACGNSSQNMQEIILIDTTAPVISGIVADITIQCNGDIVPLPVIGTDITAIDNCSSSPILQYLGETNTQGTDMNACNFYNYTLTRTWRVTDACGNSSEFAQNIVIVDTIAPSIICPSNIEVESNANNCIGNITLPKPFYFDDCTGTTGSDSLFQTQNFTNAAGGDINDVTINPLVFNFDIGNAAPEKTIASDLVLTINLNSVDGEGVNEIFSIVGEDGTVFAGTNPTSTQCGNSVTIININAALANEYAKDSVITIILSPNGSGTESINNICVGGNANLVLEYDYEAPSSSITLSYRVGGGSIIDLNANPTASLDVGNHSITYYVTDCSGNQDSCIFNINVTDNTAPTFDCPNAIITYTDSNSCEAVVTLPFPSNFADNCGAFNNYDRILANFLSFGNDANAGQVPNNVIDTFIVNMPNAIGDAELTVAFTGDNKEAGEFFNIYGENGLLLGTTTLGDTTSECTSAVVSTFTVNKDSINNWAADGNIIISALPNLDAGNFTDFINPCDTNLNVDFSDGNSTLIIGLNFPTVSVNYTIADIADNVLSTGVLLSPTIPVGANFKLGTNRVTYTITDAANNPVSCLFTVEVLDTIAPTVICNNNFVVLTNPSGDTTDLNLWVDSLVTSIGDNCGVESVIINPNKVVCADVGMTTVTVSVTDSSGNTTTCQSDIEIAIEPLDPTFAVGVCNNDGLYLYADTTFITPSAAGTTFTYSWTGPNSFTSTEANPVILNPGSDNSGNYMLTITGESGCTATGTIFVNISSIDAPLIGTVSNTVCKSDGITLTTSAANCTNLEYQWYEIRERTAPLEDTIMLAGTSTIPSFSIDNPTAGRHSYYLIVQCDDCSSLGSQIVSITVFDVPTAVTGEPVINICEGETIALSSPLTDQTCTYSWVGPGFTSSLPTPSIIENASEANEGVYTLTVSKNGCTSEEAFTVVNVTTRPNKPSIANESGAIICEENALILRTDITNANTYTWTNTSTFATYTTTSPEFSIDTSKIADAGLWTVAVEAANCTSEVSDMVEVQIEAKPNGTPFFEGIACETRTFNLNVNPVIAGASYEWTDREGTIYFGANPEVPVANQYTLTITSINACVTAKVLPIDVKVTPVITTLFDSGDADPCIVPEDTDIRLIADVFPENNGTYTYTWTTPDGTEMAPIPDSMLLIPNAVASDVNGIYSLVVNTGDGCKSNPVSNTVEVADVPIPNPVVNANATSLCEGQTLTLTATEYPSFSAEYKWQITSIMDTLTQSPVLVLDSVTTALNGVVTLQVYNGVCPSAGTATLPISVNTPLAQPMINPIANFCSGAAIALSTTVVPGATYLWEGPNYTATSTTPDIVVTGTAMVENNGGYTVQILSNGCTSPKSEPLIVAVNDVPAAPIANNSGDICLDNASDIILFIDEENTPLGAEFRWYNAANNQLVAGPNIFKSQIIDIDNLSTGTYQYYATQTLNGCESVASNITELTLAEIPTELAQVCDNNMVICDANQAVICAFPPEQGIGTWTSTDSNVVIVNPNEPETMVNGLLPGSTYTFFWTLSNGICGDYSNTRLIADVGLTGSIAKVCTPVVEECEGSTINLCANPVPTGFEGRWSQPTSQASLGVNITDSGASNTTVTTVEPGNPYNAYTFYWTVIDEVGACMAFDTMIVNVYGIPSELAQIDDVNLISCNGEAVVTANMPSDGLTGGWTSADGTIEFTNPTNANTSVNNLNPGMNTLVWSLTSGACRDYSSDEIMVFYEQEPEAVNDIYDIGFSSSSSLIVTENDQLFSPEFDITIISTPMNGTATVDENGDIVYEAANNYVGLDMFTYELCNPTCVSECSIAQVELDIGKDATCTIPTIITPNRDGVNDVFMIPCIETGNFPNNEVIIFNQWGDEIYRSAPYANDWRGTYNGEDVPAGTYYYVIAFDRNAAPKAGFLIIER